MNSYQAIFESFTENEREQLAQLKRFFERLQCDGELLDAINKKRVSPGQLARLTETGVLFGLSELPLALEQQQNMLLYIMAVSKDIEEELDDEVKLFAGQYPLLRLWGKYQALLHKERRRENKELPASLNIRFDAWRKRRIAAAKSELGFFGAQISHPTFAYELSEGCSVGCWFCSFATRKLTGVLDYNAERGNVHRVISHCINLFGKQTAGHALPYYRTEPHDNPGYIDFLRDFEDMTGEVLCTSTAVCGDIAWLRALMAYYRRENYKYYLPRLSILSPAMMDKVHDAFTPIELLEMELLIQTKDHIRPKITGGRILEENAGLRDREDFSDKNNIGQVPQGSISCVSGFIVNLVSHTVTLVSPCYASGKWPLGFRVFAEKTYEDAEHFPAVINEIIESCMQLAPPKEKPVKFRDDIVVRPTENGFDLATPNQLHHFKGRDKCGPLGELIASGNYTYGELIGELTRKHSANPLVLRAIVQKLFDDGFLDEVY